MGPRGGTFTLPHENECNTSDFSSNPADPGLDLTNPKLQHVAVSLSAFMGGDAGPGTDRGEPAGARPGSKRFAIWVDSVLKTSDEHVNGGSYPVYDRLFSDLIPIQFTNLKAGAPCAMKRTDGYDLATDMTKNFVPSAIWGTDHTLRVGFDGTSDSPRFEGEVLWVRVRVS